MKKITRASCWRCVSLAVLFAMADVSFGAIGGDDLLATFRASPDSARPEVWWHWMNGNVSRDGIVADLDAMAAVGLGGVTIFDAGCAIPPGSLSFNTPEWFDTVKFAVAEAAKRKMRVCLANCSGYSTAGGPWIAASNSMKTVCYTLTDVEGGRPFAATLPAPPNPHGFYEDIAILAWPVPPAERHTMEAAGAEVTVRTNGAQEVAYDITFPRDYRASMWECRLLGPGGWHESADATLACEAADGTWLTLSREELYAREQGQDDVNLRAFQFPETSARRWRLTVAFRNAPARRYTFGDVRLSRAARLSNIANKALFVCTRTATRPTVAAPDQIVRRTAVRDLTSSFDPATGRLAWEVPSGTWRVMRIGYAANGKQCHPASANGVGFECDKLAKSGVDAHFDAYLARMCDHLGPSLAGNVQYGFNNVLVDSWEAGSQNWTQGLEREFARRRGYDLTTWLPVLTGAVLDGVLESEKFLSDFRDVIANLFAENFADELARKCHSRGLKLSLEAYGTFPSTPELYGRAEDITMTEFWIKPDQPIDDALVRLVTERAHRTPGGKIIGAESFTAFPKDGRWRQDPFSLKATGDHMYALGVNRIIYHRYAHQPWTNPPRVPGMTMGHWGTHYERTETWWFDQTEWIAYQTRCQALLQAGTFVDDCRGGETLWTHRRYADGTDGFFVARNNGEAETFKLVLPVTGRVPEIWDPETGTVALVSDWFEYNGKTHLKLAFKPSGATFVMFRPAPTAGARPIREEQEVAARTLEGPWDVSFDAPYPDAPSPIVMTNLASLATHENSEVRYFAGHATYRQTAVDAEPRRPSTRVVLDLGDVKNLATVTVNGRTYPPLWRPPFRVDVTDAWSVTNRIAVRVATLWPNRLIGDEQLPPDCEWRGGLVKIPEWVVKGERSPTGRHTFTTWRLWKKDEPLLPSGLIGPVRRLVTAD